MVDPLPGPPKSWTPPPMSRPPTFVPPSSAGTRLPPPPSVPPPSPPPTGPPFQVPLPPPPPIGPHGSRWARTPQGRPVATVGQRIAARAIDFVVVIPLLMLLVGVEAIIRAVTGVEASETESDWVSSMLGFFLLLVFVSFDPIASLLFRGATPGKKATGRGVIRWEDGSPAGGLVLWGRNVLLFLEWVMVVPGVVDLALTAQRDDGRTWIDRATGTAVISDGDTPPPPAAPVAHAFRPEPWGSLVGAAAEARSRLARTVTPVAPGPLRERLEEVSVRVAACEIECVRVADRGLQLSQAVAETDLDALRNRYRTAAADPSRGSLVEAYGRELASAERLAGLVVITTQRLQQLGAELNSAVNTGIEIALAPSNDKTFELLLDQLDGLRASLEVVEQDAGPTAI